MRVEGSRWHVIVKRPAEAWTGEVWFFPSGMVPRALVGGYFTPSSSKLAVEFAPDLDRDSRPVQRRGSASNWGAFAADLSPEFRSAVEGGLLDSATDLGITTGTFGMTVAGEDPVNSSAVSFRTAS